MLKTFNLLVSERLTKNEKKGEKKNEKKKKMKRKVPKKELMQFLRLPKPLTYCTTEQAVLFTLNTMHFFLCPAYNHTYLNCTHA